jgi:hypothetical protein
MILIMNNPLAIASISKIISTYIKVLMLGAAYGLGT